MPTVQDLRQICLDASHGATCAMALSEAMCNRCNFKLQVNGHTQQTDTASSPTRIVLNDAGWLCAALAEPIMSVTPVYSYLYTTVSHRVWVTHTR